jgi:nucleotide-binding universal stress UspA family protein
MRKILVPYDGSHNAIRAVEYVMSRADDGERLEVHLLNVQPPIMASEVWHFLPAYTILDARKAAGERLLAPVKVVLDAVGIDHAERVLIGDPAQTIARYVAENGCDSIVMGSRGGGAIGNLVLGSTACKVINRTDVPVTLVKQTSGGFAEVPALLRRAVNTEDRMELVLETPREMKSNEFQNE